MQKEKKEGRRKPRKRKVKKEGKKQKNVLKNGERRQTMKTKKLDQSHLQPTALSRAYDYKKPLDTVFPSEVWPAAASVPEEIIPAKHPNS